MRAIDQNLEDIIYKSVSLILNVNKLFLYVNCLIDSPFITDRPKPDKSHVIDF